MKRTAMVLLALGCLLLTACGGAGEGSSVAKKYSVTLIVGKTSDPFYTSMSCGAKSAASQLGINLNVQGATEWGVSDQTPVVNAVVAAHPDAMIVVPNDSKGMITPIKKGADAGIKVVLADTTLTDTSFVSASVASNNVALGSTAADTLAQLIGKKGSVIILGASPGVSTVTDRQAGFTQEMHKYPDIKYLGAPLTTGSVNGDVQQLSAEIARYPDLTGVFSLATDESNAAGQSIRLSHKEGAIKVVGFDTAPAEIQLLQQGVVQALIGQKPYDIGVDAVTQALQAAQGKATAKFTGTGAVSVTLQNLSDPNVSRYIYKTQC